MAACPVCGSELNYIQQYKRHYCYSCKAYRDPGPGARAALAPAPAAAPAKNACPTCGKELEWIAQYSRWYCRTESKYTEPAKPAAPAPAADSKTCPKCGGALSFIADYNRWYCYNDKIYPDVAAAPSAPLPTAAPAPTIVAAQPVAAVQHPCPTCGRELVWTVSHYYCEHDRIAPAVNFPPPGQRVVAVAPAPTPAPAPAAAAKNPCPTCGRELEWIAQYSRWYCRTESKYAEPARGAAPAAAPAPAQAPAAAVKNPCPSCGKELEWIAQYSRWYCRTESKYL